MPLLNAVEDIIGWLIAPERKNVIQETKKYEPNCELGELIRTIYLRMKNAAEHRPTEKHIIIAPVEYKNIAQETFTETICEAIRYFRERGYVVIPTEIRSAKNDINTWAMVIKI